MGWADKATSWPFYPQEGNTVPIVEEAGWAPGPVWARWENVALTGIRSPDRPARSESLYRLRYPGSFNYVKQLRDSNDCKSIAAPITKSIAAPITKIQVPLQLLITLNDAFFIAIFFNKTKTLRGSLYFVQPLCT
jgi:hypothetical protein